MSAAFSYRACGLSCESDAPIAGLRVVPSEGRCDLTISMRGQEKTTRCLRPGTASVRYVSPEREESGVPVLTVLAGPDGYLLRYSEGASFLVDPRGGHVEVQWAPPLTEADASTYLLGPVLAFILRLRGTVPLHANAVVIEERGVLFVGDAGAGKSSTAAVFAKMGYPVLSDDIVPIANAGGRALAYPSHPRLSVWPDSADALFGEHVALPFHSPSYPKPYLDILDAGYGFQHSPVPIGIVYVLGARSAASRGCSSTPMDPRPALLALVRNTYCSYLLDAKMREREFDVLSQLVKQGPVRGLSFGDNLDSLASSCRTLAMETRGAMVG
ncbi:MAG: hypothetical protein ACRD3C_16505 [Vicinamibacterales bacterium]